MTLHNINSSRFAMYYEVYFSPEFKLSGGKFSGVCDHDLDFFFFFAGGWGGGVFDDQIVNPMNTAFRLNQ